MPSKNHPDPHVPVRLTEAQRTVIADVLPDLAARLKFDQPGQKTILFTPAELKAVQAKATTAVRTAGNGMRRNSFRHVRDVTARADEAAEGFGAIPAKDRVFQFRVFVHDARPPVWRRFRVKDGTLDKLHEHIQTAMGWTNSHLHQFIIGDKYYGDPDLVHGGYSDLESEDSTTTKLSDILPKTKKKFRFGYEYDFGDSWRHVVEFEGCSQAEPGERYPVCLDGARACPPEDVGGVFGYEDFLKVIADPRHEEHKDMLEWAGGPFDPETFDPVGATKRMRRGLPDRRRTG